MEIKLALSVVRGPLLALATVAVAVGCSAPQLGGTGGTGSSIGGGTGGMGGTGGGEPLEMFAADFETAFCTPRVACGMYPDLATCEAVVIFAEGYDVRNIVASARRGTVAYDPVAAAACIAALPQDCSATLYDQGGYPQAAAEFDLENISACISAFTGTVPLGGACRTQDLECAGTNFCYAFSGCTGTCMDIGNTFPSSLPVVPVGVGADCTQSLCLLPALCLGTTCALGPGHLASCDPTLGTPACEYLDDYCGIAAGATTATCLPRLAPGSPCVLADLGNFSDGNSNVDPCRQQAQCVGGVCVPFAPLGQACGNGAGCFPGTSCANGVCAVGAIVPDSCPIPM